ncbi:MAG: S1 RNA-binding domain-containing protein, partial [Leptospira sp.]|nr:S1 RNA-binding domain-containing protein [Leptospira sp.]
GEFIAFCPFSQIDTDLKGKTLTGSKIRFMISDITREKNSRIILSQKKISDKEKELKKEILKTELQVGQFVTCKIKSLHKFGIIVDMGGVDALVPASEASHKKNSELEKEFSIGQTLRAKVLSIDWKENRISLSIKDFLVDPWSNSVNFKEGDIITGTVESIKQFGIFVKLNENFSGLVPNKETGLSQKTPVSNHFKPGDSVEVFVTEVNPSKRQIALSVQKAKDARERMDYSKYLQDTDTKSVSSFGLLLKKSLSKK